MSIRTMRVLGTAQSRSDFDLLVIGGGVNGTSVAREASHRGLSVLLCERDDLASHTSSASSKLVHGGLRYLENYEFRLVREALREREILLRAAPHIVWPMRFVLPHDAGLRPRWMLRTGLFLYDNLAKRKILPGARTVNLRDDPLGDSLKQRFKTGFEYSDCWVEDMRLAVLYARDAADHGANIRTRTEVVSVQNVEGGFEADLKRSAGGRETIFARGVVNAAGPWVDTVQSLTRTHLDSVRNAPTLRLVKGSHIVTRRLFDGDHAFIFQNADGRIIFAIPFEEDFTLIGTTDVPYTSDEGQPQATDGEITYLCDAASEYFDRQVTVDQVVYTYSGVRPLYDDQAQDASDVTRDYVLKLRPEGERPVLSIYGGKITTSRKLGVNVMDRLADYYPEIEPGKAPESPLPGGYLGMSFPAFLHEMQSRFADVPFSRLRRLCRSYGQCAEQICKAYGADEILPGDISRAELRFLIEREWAFTAEDVLWRRTRRGLHMSDTERRLFKDHMRFELNQLNMIENESKIAS